MLFVDCTASGSLLRLKRDESGEYVGSISAGNRILLFVNGKHIESATDNSYQAGHIGIYTDSVTKTVEVLFHQAQVWQV
jgi:hypothetical protein